MVDQTRKQTPSFYISVAEYNNQTLEAFLHSFIPKRIKDNFQIPFRFFHSFKDKLMFKKLPLQPFFKDSPLQHVTVMGNMIMGYSHLCCLELPEKQQFKCNKYSSEWTVKRCPSICNANQAFKNAGFCSGKLCTGDLWKEKLFPVSLLQH